MNVQEWRERRKREITLPSGLQVTIKSVGLLDLAAYGKIPTPLVDTVQHLMTSSDSHGMAKLDLRVLPDYMEVINLVVMAAVVSPRITADSPDPNDDQNISIDELSVLDRLEIFNEAQREGVALLKFPQHTDQSSVAASISNNV